MPKLKAHSRRQVPQDSAKATYQTMSVGDAIVLRGKRKVAAALLKDSRVDELVRERKRSFSNETSTPAKYNQRAAKSTWCIS